MKAHDLTVSLDSWPTFEGDARCWFRIGNSVLASGAAVDVAAGRLAAETAARQYADAIRAALPSPAAPDPEAVESRLTLADAIRDPGFRASKSWAATKLLDGIGGSFDVFVRVDPDSDRTIQWCPTEEIEDPDWRDWFKPEDYDQPAELMPAGPETGAP